MYLSICFAATGTSEGWRCSYVSSIDRLVVTDGRSLGIRKELNGVFLLDTVLQGPAPQGSTDEQVVLELPYSDVSVKFWNVWDYLWLLMLGSFQNEHGTQWTYWSCKLLVSVISEIAVYTRSDQNASYWLATCYRVGQFGSLRLLYPKHERQGTIIVIIDEGGQRRTAKWHCSYSKDTVK